MALDGLFDGLADFVLDRGGKPWDFAVWLIEHVPGEQRDFRKRKTVVQLAFVLTKVLQQEPCLAPSSADLRCTGVVFGGGLAVKLAGGVQIAHDQCSLGGSGFEPIKLTRIGSRLGEAFLADGAHLTGDGLRFFRFPGDECHRGGVDPGVVAAGRLVAFQIKPEALE